MFSSPPSRAVCWFCNGLQRPTQNFAVSLGVKHSEPICRRRHQYRAVQGAAQGGDFGSVAHTRSQADLDGFKALVLSERPKHPSPSTRS